MLLLLPSTPEPRCNVGKDGLLHVNVPGLSCLVCAPLALLGWVIRVEIELEEVVTSTFKVLKGIDLRKTGVNKVSLCDLGVDGAVAITSAGWGKVALGLDRAEVHLSNNLYRIGVGSTSAPAMVLVDRFARTQVTKSFNFWSWPVRIGLQGLANEQLKT